MTWTDDKEAEHQRIRADFAEAEVERLRVKVAADKVQNDGLFESETRLLAEIERLRTNHRDAIDDIQRWIKRWGNEGDEAEWLRTHITAALQDVPRVTEAERAEALRVREGIE